MSKPDGLDFGAGLDFSGGGGLFDGPDIDPDDPIGPITYPGTVDGDLKATLDATGAAFKARAKEEARRFEAATDSEYWCALVFETRQQKEAFLSFMGWLADGDKYLDGCELAARAGCKLPPARVPYVAAKPDRKLDAISRPLE